MSNALLFVIGSFVTLLVVGALALLVWGAVLDGRYQAEVRELRPVRQRDQEAESLTRPAA